jgi:hypothetical protein
MIYVRINFNCPLNLLLFNIKSFEPILLKQHFFETIKEKINKNIYAIKIITIQSNKLLCLLSFCKSCQIIFLF